MRRVTRLLTPAVLITALALPLLVGAGPGTSPDPAAGRTVADAAALVVTAARDELATTACHAPFELDPVTGCVRPLGDGMIEYVAPDGSIGTTHGADPGSEHDHADHDHADHDHAEDDAVTAASAGSRALPGTRRKVACTPDGSARTVVLYGHRPGADRRSDHLSAIRATLERSNQAVAQSAQRSGGPLADLRMRCNRDGTIAVASVVITSNRFADLRASMAKAGYDQPHEKYLMFADVSSADANVAGTADMFLDDRRELNNRNNGRSPMYAVVFGSRNFGGSVALHELGHTMGAVQPNAPRADGHGHCTDQVDALCYPSNSSKCGALAFDCGNDKYFSTATRPGQWLHAHWNLGWEGNRFIRIASTSSASSSSSGERGPGGFTDTAGHAHGSSIAAAVERKIAAGYADGTFRPGQPVTRGQMATFLTRTFALPAGDASRFRDVQGHPHAAGVGAVVRAGITEGYADGTFRPDGVVTRAQLASFLDRALDLPAAGGHGFSDVRGSAHEAAIARVAEAGVAQGYSDGTFRPTQRVPRGQMTTFLVRSQDRA